jgi:PAS domain S-box-containing protein
VQRVADLDAAPSEDGRYRLLIDAITDYAIYMLSPDGLVSSWNPGAQRFKGYVPAEIIGRHFSTFYTEEERAAGMPEQALHIARTEGRFEREGWRVRKDGTRFWAHVVIDPIHGDNGELIGYAKITRDLTERRSAEEALRQSQEQFRLLVQGVTDYAIYMLDREGLVSSWNAGARRIKGYEPEQVIGSHFSRFYTQDDQQAGKPAESLAIARREGRFEQEGWRVRKDGSQFWAHVVIDAIYDDDKQVIGFAKITRDNTERRANQKALDEARETLLQTQKLDAIGQLTGGIAHDFNNLLSAILGSLDLVRRRLPEDPRITSLLNNAIQGAQRGASLTQRMLAFARKQELQPVAVDIADLVTGMGDFIERAIGPEMVIRLDFPDGLPAVTTDPSQLENALLNLAVNARDAMPGGGTITITARAVDHWDKGGDGAFVRLSVSDTGEGMDTVTLARATEPFFTTKGVGKGTGLGLPMVHGLALQSGGRLTVDSKPGVGTTVSIWLPVAQDAVIAPRLGPTTPSTEASLRPLRILVVDDDDLVLANTCALLEDLDHQVVAAPSGQTALDILASDEAVDIVVTDQAMPHMTGLELARHIKAGHPTLPIIIATGYAEAEGEEHDQLPRLAKPFTQDQLARMLRSAMDRSRVSAEV